MKKSYFPFLLPFTFHHNFQMFKHQLYTVCCTEYVWPNAVKSFILFDRYLPSFLKKCVCKTRVCLAYGWTCIRIKKRFVTRKTVDDYCRLIVKKVTYWTRATNMGMQIHTEDCFFHISMFFRWAFVKWSQTFLWLAAVKTRSIWLTVDDMVACCIQKHNKSSVVYPALNSTFVLI